MKEIFNCRFERKSVSKKNKMKVGRFGGRCRVFKDKDVKEFEKFVKSIGIESMNGEPTSERLLMKIHSVFGDRRRRDVPNIPDTICDALQGIVYLDDSQIEFLQVSKETLKGEWYFFVQVFELDDGETVKNMILSDFGDKYVK